MTAQTFQATIGSEDAGSLFIDIPAEVVAAVSEEPRVVETPPDLARALGQDPEAQAAFDRLSYSHKREYVDWIAGARREETRQRRIDQTLARLQEGWQAQK